MPKYDYKCSFCEVVEEFTHKMDTDYNGITCTYCNVGMWFKIFTPVATHFKGQGWGSVYRTHIPKKNE